MALYPMKLHADIGGKVRQARLDYGISYFMMALSYLVAIIAIMMDATSAASRNLS